MFVQIWDIYRCMCFFSCSKEHDYIEVFDGINKTERLALICGNRSVPTLRSQTNYLTVYFHSSANYNMKGFAATYEYLTIDIAGRSWLCKKTYEYLTIDIAGRSSGIRMPFHRDSLCVFAFFFKAYKFYTIYNEAGGF